jgi:uncharacterized protein (DUF1015 family)
MSRELMESFEVIKPFRGITYSPHFRAKMSDIICPPYDVIDEKMQEELLKKSELNYVRVVLSPFGHDHAKKTLEDFIKRNILVQSEKEKLYVLTQSFYDGKNFHEAVGIIALVSYEAKIFQHESTRPRVIEDRIELLEKTGCNTCPIFLVAGGYNIRKWYEKTLKQGKLNLLFSFKYNSTEYGLDVDCKFFETDDFELIYHLQDREFIIADGHHRFNAIKHVYQGKKNEKFFMAFISDESSGFLILPILREIKRGEEKKINLQEDIVISKNHLQTNSNNFDNPLSFLSFQNSDFLFFFGDNSSLSVNIRKIPEKTHIEILHEYIVKNIPVEFEHNMLKSISKLLRGELGCSIIPKPLSMQEIWSVVKRGKVLPPKSTYFWPKIPSGLVLNRTNFAQV